MNIVIKGQTIGTTTDIDGNYFLEVPSRSSILVFTYIGFEEQEIVVGNQININLNMHEISTGLNEVVVVGYGSQKRASIVGSITTIEPQVLSQGTTRALSNNLAGNVAGVIAVQRSGEPGADGSNFWIRGISSFQGAGTSPLVLVDGIERTLDDLNPAEIESFSVLKDASASAVYGVRGANGVILVQTKRGKLGKPTVNVHFEQSFTQPTKLPQYIGSAEYLTLLNEIAKDNGQQQSPYSQETIDHYINRTDPDLYPDVNWMDLITKDFAMNQRADITVNGGSDILRYAVVGSYYGEQGIFERDKSQSWNSGTHLNKFNLRSNVDINITKTTQLTVSVGGYLQEMNKMAISSDDAFSGAFETPPFIHPAYYKEDDNIYFPVVNQRVNPYVQVTQKGYATTSQSKIESLFALEQDLKFITPGLKIKGIFSFDRYSWSGVTRSKTPDLYQPATQRDENGNLIKNTEKDGYKIDENGVATEITPSQDSSTQDTTSTPAQSTTTNTNTSTSTNTSTNTTQAPTQSTTGGSTNNSYNNNYAPSTPSVSSSAIAAAALNQVGASQDCTMLVTNALAAVGINFHGSPEQYLSLGRITSSPVAGDIIVYSGHVAIYLGNGQAVHGGWLGNQTVLTSVACGQPFIGYVHVNR